MSDVDDALIAQVRAADPEAIARFTETRRRQLLAYVENQLGAALKAKIEPDDIVQETSLRAVKNGHLFSAGERDPFGVLCHLAQECIVDAHRRLIEAQKRAAGREVPIHGGGSDNSSVGGGLINLLVASITTASRIYSRDQKEMRMWDALDTLGDTEKEALKLRYVDGLPTKEIAEKLKKTDGAIRVLLSRSIDKLQKMLGE